MAVSLLILLLLSSSLSLSWAEEYAPVYQFTEIVGVTCPQTEWDLVLAAMTNATTQDQPSPQRKLMVRSASANTAVAAAAVGVQRELLGCPKWCGKYCMGCASLSAVMITQGPTTNETTPDTALAMINATTQENALMDVAPAVAAAAAAAAAPAADAATGGQRDLLGCPKWCGKYCVQMGIGCGTLDRRRRQLTDNTKCRKAIADIDAALAQVAVKLSQPCRDILRGPTVSCPLFSTTDCYLTHFSVWNADSGLVLIPHMNATASTKICRSFGLISLRMETNFMVGPVTLVLYEVRTDKNEVRFRQSITERAAPYTIFGLRTSNSGQRVTLRGEVLNVGSYQLQATSDDNPTHTKTVSFTVSSSC
jgi:hypothetical protein